MKGTILLATAAAALASVAVFENGALTDIASTESSQVDASLPQLPKTVPADKGVGTVSTYAFPSVGKVTLYQPKGPPKGAVIFLSGDGGWNPGVMNMARRIAGQGAVVAGVSTPAFLKSLEGDSSKCINPNFALRALAQDIQHRAGMRSYVHPILGGYSSGATVAFATLAQSPANIWRGVVSMGFGPDQAGQKPWCAAPGFTATRISKPEHGWWFDAKTISSPWFVLQGMQDQVVDAVVARNFVAKYANARLFELPKVGHGFGVEANWMPQFQQIFVALMDSGPATTVAADPGLPVTLVADASAPKSSTMAVMYSGDGGWADLDANVASTLAARGIPVVGIDSLRYFWTARSPQGIGQDLGQLIAHWSNKLGRPNVMVLGYSFGADAAPFAVAHLPPAERKQVVRLGLLGLSSNADMQFHLSNWLDYSGPQSLPTIPAIKALKPMSMVCIRGSDEDDNACPSIPSGLARQVVLPGGHHYNGRGDLIADAFTAGMTM
jgi:type IV secretory pathway VirJ component